MVYPVSDEFKYTDHHGNVLPDAYLMPDGSTPFDLARSVHTKLAENYILAIDAKTRIRLPKDYNLGQRCDKDHDSTDSETTEIASVAFSENDINFVR